MRVDRGSWIMTHWDTFRHATHTGARTLEEWREFASKEDIWWVPILPPAAVFESAQAWASGALEGTGAQLKITSPVKITSQVNVIAWKKVWREDGWADGEWRKEGRKEGGKEGRKKE
jgi:crotonobetainyl-CoA:carnitine CoA-transferase CaiB-like acyl-CoA transferase